MLYFFIIYQIINLTWVLVNAHGRIMKPPGRNSMWRFGFTNPINYNDNEVFCGGFGVQFLQNGGKCGVCGDPWHDKVPRSNEGGGKYGNGIIGSRYVTGQIIEIEIELTTNHFGWFELKLCPVNHWKKRANQECLDSYPLKIVPSLNETKYYIPKLAGKKGNFSYHVELPKGLTCHQCVIQWTYKTGNTWGDCENGTQAVGCGKQETFRNCADVEIYSNSLSLPPNAIQNNQNDLYLKNQSIRDEDDNNNNNKTIPLVIRSNICIAKKPYDSNPKMDNWCQFNCLKYEPNCPSDRCRCLVDCVAIGNLTNIDGTDVYCHRNCLRYPHSKSQCRSDQCKCFTQEELDNK